MYFKKEIINICTYKPKETRGLRGAFVTVDSSRFKAIFGLSFFFLFNGFEKTIHEMKIKQNRVLGNKRGKHV